MTTPPISGACEHSGGLLPNFKLGQGFSEACLARVRPPSPAQIPPDSSSTSLTGDSRTQPTKPDRVLPLPGCREAHVQITQPQLQVKIAVSACLAALCRIRLFGPHGRICLRLYRGQRLQPSQHLRRLLHIPEHRLRAKNRLLFGINGGQVPKPEAAGQRPSDAPQSQLPVLFLYYSRTKGLEQLVDLVEQRREKHHAAPAARALLGAEKVAQLVERLTDDTEEDLECA